MTDGKCSTASKIVYEGMELSAKLNNREFLEAIESVRPLVEVKPRRVSGPTYQVSIEVRHSRSMALAIKW